MGFFDGFIQMVDTVKQAAEAALETARRLAEEAQRQIREATEKAEQVARSVKDKVINEAEGIRHDLEKFTPNFDEKLQQIIDEVSDVASAAASEGIDITEAVNAAVEIALKKVEHALNSAIDAITTFIHEAQNKLFGFLEGILPGPFRLLLEPVKAAVSWVVHGLKTFSDKLKTGISIILDKIKATVQTFVRRVGEVLGPIWGFIKKLWKLLFGTEPEQCQLTAQWFQERMKRTEMELLNKRVEGPVSALIRKYTLVELLPPDEGAWKAMVLGFMDQYSCVSAWRYHRARVMPALANTNPRPGAIVELTWDNTFTDELGGRQRVQISVLYFQWRTEEFRKVSSGFLGILAILSAVDLSGTRYEPPSAKVMQNQPLEIDATAAKRIYDEIAPHMRLKPMEGNGDFAKLSGSKKISSRQLRYRDNEGVWRSENVM